MHQPVRMHLIEMATIRVTKSFTFEMAHALWNYDGPCRNIHGHSYELLVTISGHPITDENSPKLGMVMDFGDLKKIVRILDISISRKLYTCQTLEALYL